MWTILEIIVILMEALFLCYFLGSDRVKIKYANIFGCLGYAIFIMILKFTGVPNSLKMFLAMIYILIMLLKLYDISFTTALSTMLIYILILGICEFLAIGFLKLFHSEYEITLFLKSTYVRLEAIIFAKSFTIALLALFKKHPITFTKKQKLYERIVIILPILISVCGIGACMNIFFTTKNIHQEIGWILILSSIAMFIGAISTTLLAEYYIQNKLNKVERSLQNIKNCNNENFYETKAEMFKYIQTSCEQLKNNVDAVYLENNQLYKDVSAFINSYSIYDTIINTNHSIFNVLINEKYLQAKEKDILLDCEIDSIDVSFIKTSDICTIFGTLLDYIIQICEDAEKKDKKYIKMIMTTMNDAIVVDVENGFKAKKFGNFFTNNQQIYELLAIKEAVLQYEGSFKYNVYKTQFNGTITIPIQN